VPIFTSALDSTEIARTNWVTSRSARRSRVSRWSAARSASGSWRVVGSIVTPDPTLPDAIEALKKGEIKEFEHHSRLGFVEHEGFHMEMARLHKVGFRRITLKAGDYSMQELATALR